LDANQFWLYDNRESLPPPDENEDEEELEEESPYSSDEEYDEGGGRDTSDPHPAQKTARGQSSTKSDQEDAADDLYNFY
jgi:hypothetical protein